jgi:hypothetical protein
MGQRTNLAARVVRTTADRAPDVEIQDVVSVTHDSRSMVVPANTGNQWRVSAREDSRRWVPACAGTTGCEPGAHFMQGNDNLLLFDS